MYAITGITGQVGGELARTLLASGGAVRAVVRNADKGDEWAERGCEVALADMAEAVQLASAFAGCEGVFVLPPSEFDPAPGYPEACLVIRSVTDALAATRPAKVVCLSTIGADAPHENLLTQRTLLERSLGQLGLPITFLRPAWFMENALWDVASARDRGVIESYLQPVDRPFPMVATRDIGQLAANLLQERWSGTRIVELEGPARVSPRGLANAFATVLGREVHVIGVPRADWERLFRAQGMKYPLPRMRMLDGFNERWIEFRDHGSFALKGQTTLIETVAALVARAG